MSNNKINNKIKCELCGKEFKRVAIHLKQAHGYTKEQQKEYYDKYLKRHEEGLCLECGSPTRFMGINIGYKEFCSDKCIRGQVVQKRREEVMLGRYGCRVPLQNQTIKEKAEKTNLERYGVKNPSQNEEIKKKTIQTNLKKYGHPVTSKNKKVKLKAKQTNLQRYGHLGVSHPSQLDEIKKKVRNTNLEKYGVIAPACSQEIQDKMKETNLDKYGVPYPLQIHITNYNDWLNLEQFLIEHNQEFTCLDLTNYFSVNYTWVRKIIKFKKIEYLVKDFYSLSEPEQAFAQELDKLNIDYELHNRKIIVPQEVDFYLPDYKLAIEVSPTWTHQHITDTQVEQKYYGQSEPEYHYNKFKLCKEQGIELITVFDWTDQEKVINFIKSKIEPAQTVYARKTTTKLVQGLTKDHKDFLERNHILGSINNSQTTEVVELHYDNQVIGLAVFEQKKNYTELRRLVFEQGYRVQGGASKLIKTFTRQHPELKELITFSDNDLGTGNVYKQLGFKIVEENKGTLIWYNYKYDKKIPNLSLVKQGTDGLLKNFPGYEYVGQGEHLPSNQEIIQQYGFVPIYDCGYTKWVLTLK